MTHGCLFILLGAAFALLPWLGATSGPAAWLVLWFSLDLVWLGIAYLRRDADIFGKRPDGTLSAWRVLLFLPYLTLTWSLWQVLRLLPEAATHRINDRLTVGRRLAAGELPAEVTAILDLTAEFAAQAHPEGTRYVPLLTLDSLSPSPEKLVAAIQELSVEKHLFIHCAQGHGRTAMAAVAFLIRHGEVREMNEGMSLLRRFRPGMRLSRDQMKCLEVCERLLKEAPTGRENPEKPDFPPRKTNAQTSPPPFFVYGIVFNIRRMFSSVVRAPRHLPAYPI